MEKIYVNQAVDHLQYQSASCFSYFLFSVVLTRSLLQVQGYVTQFHSLVEEIGKRVNQFQLTHKMNIKMVELLKTSMDGAFREWNEDWVELSVLFDQHRVTFTEVRVTLNEEGSSLLR